MILTGKIQMRVLEYSGDSCAWVQVKNVFGISNSDERFERCGYGLRLSLDLLIITVFFEAVQDKDH